MRIFKTIFIVVSIYLLASVVDVIVASGNPDYQGGMTVLVILGSLAIAAPKVGYRWFDCFFAAIPFYGIFFIFRIAHRIAHLPEIDWSQRTS
jgi:hypothetical protein